MSNSVVTVAGNWSQLLCSRCYSRPGGVRVPPAPRERPAAASPPAKKKPKPATKMPTPAKKKSTPSKKKSAPAAPTPPESPQSVVRPLPPEVMRLAMLHRAEAEGVTLSPAQMDLLRRGSGEPAGIAAARYAELLVDTEARLARLAGDTDAAERLIRARDVLSGTCQAAALAFKDTYQRELMAAEAPALAPEPLETRVMREVAADLFNDAWAGVLTRRELPAHVWEWPTRDLWAWLNAHEKASGELLPEAVPGLRQLDAPAFVRRALDDLNGRQVEAGLAHVAVAEQWVAYAVDIVSSLQEARDSAETQLRRAAPFAPVNLVARLRQTGETYARGSARCLEARLIVGGFHLRIARMCQEGSVQRLRAECLAEAVTALERNDPVLGALVAAACQEHLADCADAGVRHPFVACVSAVAEVVRERRKHASPQPQPALAPAPQEHEPPSAPAKDEPRPAKTPVEQPPDGHIICPTVLKQSPGRTKLMVVAVETSSRQGSWFGYGWVDQSGQKGQGTGQAVNELDEAVQALCRIALRLSEKAPSLHLVSRHQRAVNVVQLALRAGQVFAPLDAPLSEDTRKQLERLTHRRRYVSVSAEACVRRHAGSAQAEALARHTTESEYAPDGQHVARGVADPSSAVPVDDRLSKLEEENGTARWLDTPEKGSMSWRVALHRAHLDGHWCPLPDSPLSDDSPGRQLRLHLNHEAHGQSTFSPVQRVALRRRDGRWELAHLHWPADMRPGTLVTVTMHPDRDVATAQTTPLSPPERVDGVYFAHRYDVRVATRENGPGSDQYGRVPDLTDMSWVLHTLRKLGYLTEDGEAILAEDALVQNCLRLGLPPQRTKGIHKAVERLIADHAVYRVKGSVDPDGRPWYPPRPGSRRFPLLRYVPRVEAVTAPRNTSGEWHQHKKGHEVTGFLRRLPAGAQASPEQEEAYLETVRDARIVDRGLPKGRTYVKPHYRKR
ncbi:hypothetical protein V6U81_01615 [Micromonospora sp. CPCC 205711]|uniref:hypothetical protein n=1 Tax=Micromonospora sp. CPCC 205547 TaxID=3122400 RepID=UPI002FF3DA2E